MGKFDLYNNGKIPNLFNSIKSLENKINLDIAKLNLIPKKLPISKIRGKEYYQALKDEREKINILVTEIYYNVEKINHFRSNIKRNPEHSALITISIIISIFLILFCISLPLLLLPLNYSPNIYQIFELFKHNLVSIKGFFVVLVTILICSIFVTFAVKNEQMKYTKDDLDVLNEISELKNYSKYLENYLKYIEYTK